MTRYRCRRKRKLPQPLQPAAATHMEPRVNGAKMSAFIGRSVRLPCRVLKVRYSQKTNPGHYNCLLWRTFYFGRAKRVKQGKLICAWYRSPLSSKAKMPLSRQQMALRYKCASPSYVAISNFLNERVLMKQFHRIAT